MDVYDLDYYKINRLFLSFVGLWPSMDARAKRIRVSIVSFIFVIIIISQLLVPITSKINEDLLVEISSNVMICICIQIVYVTACIHENRLKKLIDRIRVDWTKIESKEECKIFERSAKQSRIYTLTMISIFYITIYSFFFFILLPVLLDIMIPLNEPRPHNILFPVEMFFDTSKYFHISFTIVFVCLNVMAGASIAVYTLILVFLQHTNGLFDLVGHIFENAIEGNENVSKDSEEEKIIYKRLVRGVWFHRRTIEFISEINSVCEICYLIEISLAGLIIAVDSLRLLQVEFIMENARQIIMSVMLIQANMSWFLANCYFGQKILDTSSNLYTKLCSAKWYLFSTKAQKLMLLVIMRSVKPSYVSIGKIFISSLEFYLTIVQTSVSYAMIVYSLRQ